jgi:putative restriction endonuclease
MNAIIKSEKLRYFIFDTGVTGTDIDFVQYDWNRKRFNKVREGDYFIYRRPQKVSENKKFYFFGTGRVGKITDYDDRVICDVEEPIRFKNIIYQDDIVDYQWKWKSKTKNDFQQFFNNYGMNTIPFEDLEHFFKLGVGEIITENFDEENKDLVESHIQLKNKKLGKLGNQQITQSRGSLGKIFSDNVQIIYDNKCCITGITTRSILNSSHISPWSEDIENRANEKNGLLLSLILHKCFDKGLLSIDDDYKVIISKNIKDEKLKLYLKSFEGNKIRLPVRKEFYPDKNLLKIHRENVFKS